MALFEKKDEKLVGASEKLAAVERMRAETRTQQMGGDEMGITPPQTVPVVLVFGLSVAFIAVLDGMGGASMKLTNIPAIDNFIFNAHTQLRLIGDADADKVLSLFARGLGLFLLAGVVPLIGRVISRASRNKFSPIVGCWTAIIVLPLLYLLLGDLVKGFL